MSSISDYIEDQLSKGRTKKEVKSALKRQGWPDKDVNDAFKELNTSKAKSILLVVGIIGIVLTGSILYLFLPDFDESTALPENQVNEPQNVETSNLGDCNSLPYTTEKSNCYTQLIQEEQDICRELTNDRERNFCFSALEDYLLSM